MKVYQNSKESLFQMFSSTPDGLKEEEARQSAQKYGKNELVEGKKKGTFRVFLEQFADFLVIILIVAAVISAILQDVESSLVILFVITMNAILGTVQHKKAEASLESLKKMSAPMAKVYRGGQIVVLPSREVVVGDVVALEAGDYVPADGRMIECATLQVNESALTGESTSVEKEDCTIEGEVPLGDQRNMVFSGSFVTYGRGIFLVTAVGMDTEVGKIASLIRSASEKRTPLQRNLDNFGKKLSIGILVICALVFGMSLFSAKQINQQVISDAFMFAVALAVAAIPEALSSIVTIVLAFGTQKMARENAIIRKLQAVEGLGSVSIICSDKTGTLTQNKMTVESCYFDGRMIENTDDVTAEERFRSLVTCSILCNDSQCVDGAEIGDPTEVAFVNLAARCGMEVTALRDRFNRLSEIPFDSDRKLMTTVHEMNGKYYMITKGAPDVVCSRLSAIDTAGGVVPATKERIKEILDVNRKFSENGLRVLAFAYREISSIHADLNSENDLVFLGLISMMDPPRVESKDAVLKCIQAGIRPIMITGDHKVTASAIAKKIGILTNETIAVEGSEIDALTDEELQNFVEKVSVYARVSPEHKIRIVRAWQNKGNIVAMTGDGVNDAPALKQADIGVAMGITGTEVSKDASSMVLTDDNFATIVKAVENGRNISINIKKAIKVLLSGNMAGILAVLYASIAALPVPFASVHLLFINLLTDSLPAIALGLDPHTSEVMKEKPRPANESILTKDFLLGILIEGLVIGVNTMIAFHIGLGAGGAGVGATMAFSTLCLSRLVHGFNSKSERAILFTRQMWNNKWLYGAFFVGLLLLNSVLFIPSLAPFFKISPLTLCQVLAIYGLSISNLFEIQLLKWVKGRIFS